MRIGIIFTGGTIGSCRHASGIGPSERAPRLLLALYRARTGDETEFYIDEPYTALSENLTFSHLSLLAQSIQHVEGRCDAVIVTHGTDSLAFTAAALSYLRGLSSMPVVLVSANFVLEDPRGNGLDNFCGAISFLRHTPNARGVYVAYRNTGDVLRIHRAARVLPHASFTDAVLSVGSAAYADMEGGIMPTASYHESKDAQEAFPADALAGGAGKVLFTRVHPECYPAISRDTAAVLLETYHSGTLPTESPAFRDWALALKAKGIPVFAVGAPAGGTVYESGNHFEELGILPLPPLSPTAAYVKLCLCVGSGRDLGTSMSLALGGDL